MAQKPQIVLGADHAGFPLKEKVREYLTRKGYSVLDHGPPSPDPVDYPDYAALVAQDVASGRADFGVVICGTGIGMAISANKVLGVRAASCNDTLSAHFARAHNNANVLAMGGRLVDPATAEKILDTWLSTTFEGGRHQRRVEKIALIEQKPQSEKKA